MPTGIGTFGLEPKIFAKDTDQQANDLTYKTGVANNESWGTRLVSSAAADAGNTPTTLLRSGLLLGRVTATFELKEWNPTGTDGSEVIRGIMASAGGHDTLRNNTATDKYCHVLLGGNLKAERVLVPGQASAGLSSQTLEHIVRTQLVGLGFNLDDTTGNNGTAAVNPSFGGFGTTTAKTADYTVLEADNGTLFTTRGAAGAVNFTLPATAKKGLHYGFFSAADQNMTVTSGTADTVTCFNDLTADSVAFSTSSEKIGGMFEVFGDGTGWLVKPSLGQDSQTITVAT